MDTKQRPFKMLQPSLERVVFEQCSLWRGEKTDLTSPQLESEEKQPFSSMTLTAIRGNGDDGSE